MSRIIKRLPSVPADAQARLEEYKKARTTVPCPELPLGEVYEIRNGVYGILFESLNGSWDVWCYIICGDDGTAVIDTAFGHGDLLGAAMRLGGGKPLTVFNTHSHFDHVSGNGQFERVYCGRREAMLPGYVTGAKASIDKCFNPDGTGIYLDCNRSEFLSPAPVELIPCDAGNKFTLGDGHILEIFELPGHAPGEICILDRKNRILFSGDAVLDGRIPIVGHTTLKEFNSFMTVTSYRKHLETLLDAKSGFDIICPGHFVNELPSGVLEAVARVCDEIIAGTAVYTSSYNAAGVEVRLAAVPGLGCIEYKPNAV